MSSLADGDELPIVAFDDDHPRDELLARPTAGPGESDYGAHAAAVGSITATTPPSVAASERNRTLRFYIGACHDFAKATAYFQEYIRGERESSDRTYHAALGGLAAFYMLDRADSELDTTPAEKALAWYAIHRHHSGLIDINDCYARTFDDDEHVAAIRDQLVALQPYAAMIEAAYAELPTPIAIEVEAFVEWVASGRAETDVTDALGYLWGSIELSRLPDGSAYRVIDAFGHLIAADRLNASGIETPARRELPADLVERYVGETFGRPEPGSINALREAARRTAEHSLRRAWDDATAAGAESGVEAIPRRYNLSLPTGLGKTLTGEHAALLLRERITAAEQDADREPPRIVYVLPYTSIIDQVVSDAEQLYANAGIEIEPATLLKHHYLSAGYRDDESYDPREQRLLSDRWESEVIVTTYVQLIEALLTPSTSQALRYPTLSNAIVILDEPQSIRSDLWPAVDETLTWISERWNTYIISMTATHPRVAIEDDDQEQQDDALDRDRALDRDQELDSRPFVDGESLIPYPERFHDRLDRVRYRIDSSVDGTAVPLAEWARRGVEHAVEHPDDDVLLICNTLRAAERVYDQVAQAVVSGDVSGRVRYLSSHVRPIDRAERIAELTDDIDRDRDRRITVSTQVVETGVDLSADHLIRDYAPLDTIVQAAGRCNRHALTGASGVDVLRMAPLTADEPPCAQVYDPVKLDMTRAELRSHGGAEIPERDMTAELLPSYFDAVADEPIADDPRDQLHAWQFDGAAVSLIPDDGDEYQLFICRDESDEDVLRAFATALDEGDRDAVEDLKAPFYERVVSARENHVDTAALDPADGLTDGIDLLDADRRLYAITDPVADRWYDERVGLRVR